MTGPIVMKAITTSSTYTTLAGLAPATISQNTQLLTIRLLIHNRRSEPLDVVEADERTAELEEGVVNILTPLVADG